ncbi:MAG: serine/threonine protein kinase [Ruminococcaceae bacterium]|nr:serine/threonine protein kinase [Oscillospiraceae bacterium]
MNYENFIENLKKMYDIVGVLADKNDCKTLRLRHKKIEKDLVLHRLPKNIAAYESLSKIECENLPVIYDVIDLDDFRIVLEEFISGITVADVMETGRYTYHGAKKVIQGVCNALSVLHSRNIVHRDIKPENIMVDSSGRVVLIDFNASRTITPDSKDTVVMGTVGYASPEQIGIAQSDSRTDIYAIGVLLNVMMTGKHPSELIAKGKAGRIVRKCTNVNPNDRYQTVEKLSGAL